MVRTDRDGNSGDSGSKKNLPVTVAVNGKRLQTLRLSAGMTQEELAKQSGYSERLIRKAEASGRLRKSTIGNLAKVLSTSQQRLTADDLTFSNEMQAMEWFERLLGSFPSKSSPTYASDLSQHRDPNRGHESVVEFPGDFGNGQFNLWVAGEALGIPFAGSYKGNSAYATFRQRLAQVVSSIQIDTEQIVSFTAQDECCIQSASEIKPVVRSANTGSLRVWWFLTVKFEANFIHRMELMYDTGIICRLVGCINS